MPDAAEGGLGQQPLESVPRTRGLEHQPVMRVEVGHEAQQAPQVLAAGGDELGHTSAPGAVHDAGL
jgi:hypothetical protein